MITLKNNAIKVVFKKEMIEIFRDKKTIIIGILIPLFLFPLISFILGNTINISDKKIQQEVKITIQDKGSSKLSEYIKKQTNINIANVDNPEESLQKGDIYLYLNIPEKFDDNIQKNNDISIDIIFDNSSRDSLAALSIIQTYIDMYSKGVVSERLNNNGIDSQILKAFETNIKTIEDESEGDARLILSMILPLLLILYSITGTMAPAMDLGAGEKERGTLEPLLTTKVNRMSLLWGKFFAITVVGIMMSIAAIVGIELTMVQQNGIFKMSNGGTVKLLPIAILFIVIVPILNNMIFGALGLVLSIYARSFKEAQTYLSPLSVIGLIGCYSTMMIDPKNIKTIYFNIPIANSVCLLKEMIVGVINYYHILITLGWTAIYILVSLYWAKYMFSKENVIFRT